MQHTVFRPPLSSPAANHHRHPSRVAHRHFRPSPTTEPAQPRCHRSAAFIDALEVDKEYPLGSSSQWPTTSIVSLIRQNTKLDRMLQCGRAINVRPTAATDFPVHDPSLGSRILPQLPESRRPRNCEPRGLSLHILFYAPSVCLALVTTGAGVWVHPQRIIGRIREVDDLHEGARGAVEGSQCRDVRSVAEVVPVVDAAESIVAGELFDWSEENGRCGRVHGKVLQTENTEAGELGDVPVVERLAASGGGC